MDLIYFLVMTNLLALAGTLVGLGLFGLFPSIVTTYTLVKMRLRNESFSIGSAFVQIYKREFVRANKIGLLVVTVWSLLLFSWFFYLEEATSTFHALGLVVIGLFAMIFFVVTMILPITMVYFPKFSFKDTLVFSAMLSVGMPLLSMVIVLNVLFFYFIVMIRFISIFPFLVFTLPTYVNMIVAKRRIMNLFTVFKDETVAIRTLNSFAAIEEIHRCLEDDTEISTKIPYETYESLLKDGTIEARLSLVMLDKEEHVIGFLLSRYDQLVIWVEALWVHPSYRRRGYATKMLKFIKQPFEDGKIDAIQIYDEHGFYEDMPREVVNMLPFFRNRGFLISGNFPNLTIRCDRGAL